MSPPSDIRTPLTRGQERPLASSWISRPSTAAGSVARAPSIDPQELESLRFRGWRGGWITPHRAFARVSIRPFDLAASLLLVVAFCIAWLLLLARVGRLW